MTADIEATLHATTPDGLPEPDVAELLRRGRRRRVVKRAASGVALGLVVLAAVLVPAALRQAPDVRFGDEGPAAWSELDLEGAVERLRAVAAAEGYGSPAAGVMREVRILGVAGRGATTAAGTDEWLAPFEVRMREEGDGGWFAADQREGARIERGATVQQVRAVLTDPSWEHRATTPPDFPPPPDESLSGVWRQAMHDAEDLATRSDPFEPSPGETERPDRAYAYIRLADALRTSFDDQLLDRGFGVLLTLGEQWVDYRGVVEDLLGREALAFAAADPANGTETMLLFDPETGRLRGEYEFVAGDGRGELLGAAAIEYAGW